MTLTYQIKTKFAVLLGVFLLLPFFAYAQESISLSVSPTIYEMTANPSQVWESNLRIINNNPFELTVYAEALNFVPLGEQGASQFIEVDETDPTPTLAEWISTPDTAIVIPAEQTVQIPLVIELPEEVPPGGHYAAVLVGTQPPEDRTGDSQVEISQVVSSLIFLRVSGDIIEEGNVRSFRTTESIVEAPKVNFEMRFQNTGNVHLRPEGHITIYNMWGQERGKIPINRTTLFGNVLKDSIRSFNFAWEGEWSPVDIGRYTAEVALAYGDDEKKFTYAYTAFWVIPWKVLLGILLTIAVFVYLISYLIKLYVRRMLLLAGMDHGSAASRHTKEIIDSGPEMSVTAPIEAGILDLRKRFDGAHAGSPLAKLFGFIADYKIFFMGVLIFVIALYLIVWFIGSVSQSEKSFEATINSGDQTIVVDSESLDYKPLQTDDSVQVRDVPPLRIVNSSAVPGAAADLALDLEEFGYRIDSVSTELNTAAEDTVIVHDPLLADQALELSTILDNALTSVYATGEDPTITIYVGKDLAD